MSRFVVVLFLLSAAFCMGSQAWALPTTDELFTLMADKEAKMKSLQADITVTEKSEDRQMSTAGHMALVRTEQDGKSLRKFYMTMKATLQADQQTMIQEIKVVSDGHLVWQEMRLSTMPVTQVVKGNVTEVTARMVNGPLISKESIDQFRKPFDLDAVAEDSIDGRKVYVIEGKLKADQEQAGSIPSKIKFYVDQETLSMRRLLGFDAAGNEFTHLDMTNVKLDEEVDPKTFDYTPPQDAKVTDLTKEDAGQ